jgi:hypothetical protein
MKYLILITIILFTGCCEMIEMNNAKKQVACESHNGIYKQYANYFICNDGTEIKLQNISGPKVTEALKRIQDSK